LWAEHQWIHVDVDRAAKESRFKGTVAHGYLTLFLIPHLMGSGNASVPVYPGIKVSVNYGMNRVLFPNPVAAGSNLRSRSKMISVDKVNDECFQVVNEVTIVI